MANRKKKVNSTESQYLPHDFVPNGLNVSLGGANNADANTDAPVKFEPKTSKPPAAAIGRMSLYLRELRRLEEAAILAVNSRDLANRLNVSPAIVRRDLAWMGSVGKRGVGYEVTVLAGHLSAVLGSNSKWRVALIGTGSLGQALLRYPGFERLGFELVVALDTDPNRIGEQIAGLTIKDAANMKTIFRQSRPQLAILAVPADVAAEVAIKLAREGVSGILNFAPTSLKLPPEIGVVNVDLASEMQRLAFHVSQRTRQYDTAPNSDPQEKQK